MRRIRRHLTFANVVSVIALFVALGLGTAWAVERNSVESKHIVNGEVKSADVENNGLTGRDIADRSGVDTCKKPLVKKFGPICVGTDGVKRSFNAALIYCIDLGLRLPSESEALALSKNYDVPGVDGDNQYFWTDEQLDSDTVVAVNDLVGYYGAPRNVSHEALCVTDPSA
jgi:hypothetical protein